MEMYSLNSRGIKVYETMKSFAGVFLIYQFKKIIQMILLSNFEILKKSWITVQRQKKINKKKTMAKQRAINFEAASESIAVAFISEPTKHLKCGLSLVLSLVRRLWEQTRNYSFNLNIIY